MTTASWEMVVPVISIAHTPPAFDTVVQDAEWRECVYSLGSGWLLFVSDDRPEAWEALPGMPAIVAWMNEEYPDTSWVRLDADGDVIPELPKFERE